MSTPTLTTVGRWTVLRYAAPAMRRESDHGNRRRVYCRCVCGREEVLWVQDLLAGRTTGCKSIKCRARNDAVAAVTRLLDDLATGDRAARAMANRFKAKLAQWQVETRREERIAAERRLADELAGRGLYGDEGGDDG